VVVVVVERKWVALAAVSRQRSRFEKSEIMRTSL